MGERQEVEVVCWRCNGSGIEDYRTDPPRACWGCDRTKQRTALVPEGSLTAALLRLADAAEAVAALSDENPARDGWDRDHRRAFAVYEAALAALRAKRAGG